LLPTWPYLVAVIAAAFAGTLVGKCLIKRLPQRTFHPLVARIAITGMILILTNL
jgi:uncharacterized membrane protein YfcA